MKRTIMIGLAVLLGLIITRGVYAKDSCSSNATGFTAVTNVNIESVRKFLKDTSAARDELIIKRIELLKEYKNKEVDYGKIGTIQKDIIDLKTKIMDSAKQYGLDKALIQWLRMRHDMMKHGRMGGFGHCDQRRIEQNKADKGADTGTTSENDNSWFRF